MVADITTVFNTGWKPGATKLCCLCDSVAETIGVDESTEYHDDGNAASDNYGNEANSTTGWGQVGLDQGANIFQSQASVVDTGSYAIQADSNDTPTGGALFYKRIGLDFGLVAGKMYKLSFAARHVGTGDVWHAVLSTGLAAYQNKICILSNTDTTFQDFEVVFRHDSDTEYFIFREFSVGNSGGVYFDNFSVIECGDLVENGTFLDDWGWTKGDGWTISGGVASSDGSQTDVSNLEQDITVVVGKTYVIEVEITAVSAEGIYITGTGGNWLESFIQHTAVGVYNRHFVATSTTFALDIRATADFVGSVDNVRIREVAPDRSISHEGLEVYGQITKAAVATGAELMGYGNYSTKRFFKQSYNSALDYATGNFYWAFWFKILDNGGAVYIFDRNDGSGAFMQAYLPSTGELRFNVKDTSVHNVDTTQAVDDGKWHFAVLVYDGTKMYIYLDGTLNNTTTVTLTSLDNANAILVVGAYYLHTSAFINGSLALLRTGAYAPTPSQIEKMYRDEKVFFEENADCLLAGTSDAITALAHDPLTKQLHAGTNYGRSASAGLERVASEATAVGAINSLAACGGIIAQGGDSGADVYVPAKSLREELARADDQAVVFGTALEGHWGEGDGTTTDFALPSGWKPKFVYNTGALVKEGSADQYTIKFDGFIYTVSFNTAPANGNDLCFMTVRRQS